MDIHISINKLNLKCALNKILTDLVISSLILGQVSFSFSNAYAQTVLGRPPRQASTLNLPSPGLMITQSSGFVPALIKGIKIYPDNPFQLDFIVDLGQSGLENEALKKEGSKLIKYFLASLTTPSKELWVNLSPYEKDRIIPDKFGQTEMGRDLLAQDYILKQLTASFLYPEEDLGKEFWDRVYAKASEIYGKTDIPINTFNKVWIVPDEAVVYENGDLAFIAKSHLKVMLEGDYLALKENLDYQEIGTDKLERQDIEKLSDISSAVVREVILPEIEKEVNEGTHFVNLRQIYSSMILATWYKRNLKESILGRVYSDQNKVNGVDVEDKEVKEKIYQQYLEAFKRGVYSYIKEDYNPYNGQTVPRKYFSGGFEGKVVEKILIGKKVSKVTLFQTARPTEDARLYTLSTGLDVLKRMENLIEIFNAITESEDVPQIPEGANEDEVLMHIIDYLKGRNSSRITWIDDQETDNDGNIIVKLDQRLKRTDLGKKIVQYVMDGENGVKAINFKGTDGEWRIMGFKGEVEEQREIEQKEIQYRKAGDHWIVAYNKARQGSPEISQNETTLPLRTTRKNAIVGASTNASKKIRSEKQSIVTRIKNAYLSQNNVAITDRQLFHIIISCFGISETHGVPEEEEKVAEEILEYLSQLPIRQRENFLVGIEENISKVTHTTTYKHRYMPLILSVINMFRGLNIFSDTPMEELIQADSDYKQLQQDHLFYGNPFDLETEWVPEYLPSAIIEKLARKDKYRWLDIGASYKPGGAPSLLLIKEGLKHASEGEAEVFGTDIFYPPFIYDQVEKEAKVNAQYEQFKNNGSIEENGTVILNANLPKYDITKTNFSGNHYDFISMSMTYHHLRSPGEHSERVAIGQNFQWFDEDGSQLKKPPTFLATPTQVVVLENILNSLEENGGIALLNLSSEMNSIWSNDVFVVVQRQGEKLTIFSQVIPFRPRPIPYSTLDTLFAEIQKRYPFQTADFYSSLEEWLLRSDILVYRYQERDKSAWFWEEEALTAIRNGTNLPEVFFTYLGGVPDIESRKSRIMEGIEKLSKSIDYSKIDEAKRKLEDIHKRIKKQWEVLLESRSWSEVPVHPSVQRIYDNDGNQKPFHGLTIGSWINPQDMAEAFKFLKDLQNELKTKLEEAGLEKHFTFHSLDDMHLTLYDLITVFEIIEKKASLSNGREWPDQLNNVAQKLLLNSNDELPDLIKSIVDGRVAQAFKKIGQQGQLVSDIEFDLDGVTAIPGRSISVPVIPEGIVSLIKIEKIRKILEDATGIILSEFFGHITLAVQVRTLTAEQNKKYIEILQELNNKKSKLRLSRIEERMFDRVARFGEPLISLDLELKKDSARTVSSPVNKGGIDLNEDFLNLRTQGQGINFEIPFNLHNIETVPIDGLSPVIFQIIPTNLPVLLGVSESETLQAKALSALVDN